MSLKAKPLSGRDLPRIVLPVTASQRTVQRLREELHARDMSQRDLAEALTKRTGAEWTQSKVGKVLTGRVELKVDDAAEIAAVVGLTLTEVVRETGVDFCAEMTPTELQLWTRLRRNPTMLRVIYMLHDMLTPGAESRPPKPKRGRPLNSSKV